MEQARKDADDLKEKIKEAIDAKADTTRSPLSLSPPSSPLSPALFSPSPSPFLCSVLPVGLSGLCEFCVFVFCSACSGLRGVVFWVLLTCLVMLLSFLARWVLGFVVGARNL